MCRWTGREGWDTPGAFRFLPVKEQQRGAVAIWLLLTPRSLNIYVASPDREILA